MNEKKPPRSPDDFVIYIRRLSSEYTRRLSLNINSETSQKLVVRSSRIEANEFLKRNAYYIGKHINERGLRENLVLHVSQMAHKYRGKRSGFANKNASIFVWVLRLVVIHQARKGRDEINRKTMSKYAHQLDYAALHNIHHNWLTEFLKVAGTDQNISDGLKTAARINVSKHWLQPKSAT